jgi:hypothetical protein
MPCNNGAGEQKGNLTAIAIATSRPCMPVGGQTVLTGHLEPFFFGYRSIAGCAPRGLNVCVNSWTTDS